MNHFAAFLSGYVLTSHNLKSRLLRSLRFVTLKNLKEYTSEVPDFILYASKINSSVILAFSVMHKQFREFIFFNLEVRNGKKHFEKGFHRKQRKSSVAEVIFKWFPLFSTRNASSFLSFERKTLPSRGVEYFPEKQ